jgi:type VI secretion system protein ImpD
MNFPQPSESSAPENSEFAPMAPANAEPLAERRSVYLEEWWKEAYVRVEANESKSSNNSLDNFLGEGDSFRRIVQWFGPDLLRKKLAGSGEWLIEQLDRDIAKIDSLVQSQLNVILHGKPLQALEAAWRGLEYLVNKRDDQAAAPIEIRVLNVSWFEIRRDVEAASEFDQSQIFRKVYEEGIGTPGANPFSVLIADFFIRPRPSRAHPFDDLYILRSLSQIAAAAFCPLIINADPAMFSCDEFSDLRSSTNIESLHSNMDFFAWQRFRETEDSRFVSLALPKILMRKPYRETYDFGFPFRETVTRREDFLWGGAAYGMGEVLMRAFGESRWLSNIRGAHRGLESGGLVTGPAYDSFPTEPSEIASKSITDVVLSDEFERELASSGFLPLCACKDMPMAAFYSCLTAQKAKTYNTYEASASARLSIMLNYILCTSRFAHYLKIISRDKIGSCATAEDLQRVLQRWIVNYVSPDPSTTPAIRARRPLLNADVRVRSRPGTAGEYDCVMHLAPHHELDDMAVSIRLDTTLVQPNRN